MSPSDKRIRAIVLLFYGWVTLRNAWLCEDAFITFRVVDNVVHGFGPRWNTLERVQVYTHPLWMIAVSAMYALTRNISFAALSLSLVCSFAAVGLLLFRGLRTPVQCLLAGVVLTFSKAFVDFSTGGLENPMSHLLLVLFFVEYLKPADTRRFERLVAYAGLGLVNRMDLVWFFLPALAEAAGAGGYLSPRRLRAWAGLLPFVAWEVFAVVYYGFAFPNSAYAKLTAGVGRRAVLTQGASFLVNSLSWDPLTLFVIGGMLAWGFAQRGRDRRALSVALGVTLYVAYVTWVGGDYMSGRPLTGPLIASVMLLSRVEIEEPKEYLAAMAVLLGLGLTSPRPPICTTDRYVSLESSVQSVDDERGYRHRDTSLLLFNKDHGLADRGGWIADGLSARASGARVVVFPNIGYFGFFAGPHVHVIDPYGIGDPLMARVPFRGDAWSSGHFFREVPDGYPEAAIGEGTLSDDALQAYWSKLELVTRGPLWSQERFAQIARFAFGKSPFPPSHPQ